MRLELACPIVQKHPRGAQLGEACCRRKERVVLLAPVEQAAVELATGLADRVGGDPQVVDVVQWIVQPEHIDPARGRTLDEPAHELVRHRPGADEEPAANSKGERRLHARLDCADPLPWALDAPPDAGVEHAAARDLEIGEARLVENLGETEQLRSRHRSGERLLREHADRGVDELRHHVGP